MWAVPIALIISIHFYSFSQNLIPNSGFEEYLKCPNGFNTYGTVLALPHWFSPTLGTPDYFNECSQSQSGARINWAGRCDDYSGKGYVGIITFMMSPAYREYLSVELIKPLDSGVTYSLQFSFRLSSHSQISSGQIGLAFTNQKIKVRHDKRLSQIPVLLAMPDSATVMKTGSWQTVSSDYVAKGGERYVTIGNFSNEDEVKVYRIKFGGNHEPMLQNASFYFIDDVIVQPQVEFIPDIPMAIEDSNPFGEDSLIVLKNVQFAYNDAGLNPISKVELNRLLEFLKANLSARIAIHGHTDDQGSGTYNRELSLKRARSVVNYLIQGGIDPERMSAFVFGKSIPLINSTDETSRSINRRVEVKLLD